jgi:hypothetical protein
MSENPDVNDTNEANGTDNDAGLKSGDELLEMADEGRLTPDKLQEELKKYRDAYQQEFEIAQKIAPENCEEHARDFFKKNLPELCAQIVWLATNATSESIQLSASKFSIELAIDASKGDGDPVKEMIKRLQKGNKDSKVASS